MNRSTTAAVSAFSAVHTGFDRDEEAIVDGFLDLSCEVNEAVEIVARSERVELVMSRRLRFRENIEPENRVHAVLLHVGEGERRRLKITVGFSWRVR